MSVLTAEEFFNKKADDLKSDREDMPQWMIVASIEFAKLHVKAALETSWKVFGGGVDEDMKEVMLNVYTEDLIK